MLKSRAVVLARSAALGAAVAVALAGAATSATATRFPTPAKPGEIGPRFGITPLGRQLDPIGRMTAVGNFPTGGALTPDGRFYWAVSAGHGHDDVHVVDVHSGKDVQMLPLPGTYGQVAFSPDGRIAYVSGEPKGVVKPSGPTKGDAGDVVHVFAVDPATGKAVEGDPIALPATSGGLGQQHGQATNLNFFSIPGPGASSGNGWPEGLAVTPDGRTLVVALGQADQVALVDLRTRQARLVQTGTYPHAVAVGRDGRTAYVTTEGGGTLDVIDLPAGTRTGSIDLGGPYSHPESVVLDPRRAGRAYVSVTQRDEVVAVDLRAQKVVHRVSVARTAGPGAQPVGLAISPDAKTLYAGDVGEDAVAVIAVAPRHARRGVPRIPGFSLVGRIPVGDYPSGVAVTSRRLVWLASKGLGAGPNPSYGTPFAHSEAAPYGSYVLDALLGRVGVLRRPTDRGVRAATARADAEVVPLDRRDAPAGTVVRPDGPIKHVFYVVKENRTYDQVFGSDPRGDGDPSLELFDDNGVGGPASGVTPNAHALSRRFGLLDAMHSDSEVSVDGHIITSSAYANDYVERALQANYSGRGRADEFGAYPITLPPRHSLFDQAVAQGVSFKNFGESAQGSADTGEDGRSTRKGVQDGTVLAYPPFFGCAAPSNLLTNQGLCDTDSGSLGPDFAASTAHSRFDAFRLFFQNQLSSGQVPALTYLTMPNDHTNGVKAGYPTPRALVADNDLGVGQLVDLISHSPIWSSSAIFVVEDDSQDGADHVDAHRSVAAVISPWTTQGQVVHTRYDQESVLATIEKLVGLRPLSLFDGLAAPMYDLFRTDGTPDLWPYDAITPEVPLGEVTSSSQQTAMDRALPAHALDRIPEELLDAAFYRVTYGAAHSPYRGPGPHASSAERARAASARRALHQHRAVARMLIATAPADGDDGPPGSDGP